MRTTTALLVLFVTFSMIGAAQSPTTPRSKKISQPAQDTVVLSVRGMT